MIHVLVVDDHVVLGGHVISDVVVDNKSKETVEQGKVNLLIHLVIAGFHHHVALTFTCVPYILKVVDAYRERGRERR